MTYILKEIEKEKIEKVIENLPRKYELEKKEIKESKKRTLAAKNPEPEAKIVEKKDEYLEEKKVRELEEYIAYYELIRQKIKGRVTALYKRPGKEGRVGVAFLLNRRGAVKKLEINDIRGSDKKYLEKIARQAVKSASPFPPFPEELQKPELTFTVAIIFTRDR
ncbi:MAG: energy transducer TonB [Omnitrophica bacterium]|nr:energy transducer TonB [Candidatus Omnitrophota bacterium]